MLAPAIAPWENGRHDLKNRWSPPVKWKYGVIKARSEEFVWLMIDTMRGEEDIDGE